MIYRHNISLILFQDGNTCRQLFCPNGQFHTTIGDCKHIAASWDVEYVTFTVKLAPKMYVDWVKIESFIEANLTNKNDTLNLNNTQRNTFDITGNGGFLQMPLSACFEVERIYIDTAVHDRDSFQERHFVAKLRLRLNVTDPAEILQLLSSWLDKYWTIQIENTTSIVYQTVYPYEFPFDYCPDNPLLEVPTYKVR